MLGRIYCLLFSHHHSYSCEKPPRAQCSEIESRHCLAQTLLSILFVYWTSIPIATKTIIGKNIARMKAIRLLASLMLGSLLLVQNAAAQEERRSITEAPTPTTLVKLTPEQSKSASDAYFSNLVGSAPQQPGSGEYRLNMKQSTC